LAIGGAITSWACAGGGESGGAYNPAVGVLPLLFGVTRDFGIYWIGPPLGAVFGVLLFWATNPAEFEDEGKDLPALRKHIGDCLNEFVGTMLFCLVISLSAGLGTPAYAGLGIGTMLMVVVYMGGHISGGHYNPAVSLAVWMRGKAPWWKCILYVVFQCLGSIVGGGISYGICADGGFPGSTGGAGYTYGYPAFGTSSFKDTYGEKYGWGHAFGAEFIGTFILCSTVLATATCDNKNQKNSFYGLAIGFSVVISAYAFGGVSGGAFNPAVGLLPIWAGTDSNDQDTTTAGDKMSYISCYWTATYFGALCAAFTFWLLNPDEGYFNNPEKVHTHGETGSQELHLGEATDSVAAPKDDAADAAPAVELAVEEESAADSAVVGSMGTEASV
jgi:aquaporin Z